MDPCRQRVFAAARCVIVKVGTRVLTRADAQLDVPRIQALSEQLCNVADAGYQVILVSSGAVGAGMGRLQLSRRPGGLAKLQAVAAIGQARLIQAYETAMTGSGYHAAQVLLTAEELRNRTAYLNVRNALSAIHGVGAIPIVNENDSVAVDELMTTFGDNDRLAAAVSGLMQDAVLVMLSDVEGLMDGPPEQPGSRVIHEVQQLDEKIWALVQSPASLGLSKGGMASKLRAAAKAGTFGHATIIASGRQPEVLSRLVAGHRLGTLFLPSADPLRGRRRWIGGEAEITGQVTIDAGAARALARGKSLLAIGITGCEGDFGRGDCVRIVDPAAQVLGRGLINYAAADVAKILGLESGQIRDVLGNRPYDAVIHRDNMALGADG